PSDLKPLLATPVSEMRLVITRYSADRNTLIGHFAGQGRGGGGGRAGGRAAGGAEAAAPAPPPPAPVPLSAARIARLKRYDLDWQAALKKIDPAKLSALAKPDLVALNATIESNLKQVEADALTLAQVTPAIPFASRIVDLVEARIRVDPMDGQKAAETTVAVIRTIKDLRAAFESNTASAPKLTKVIASRAADATAQLRSTATEWFNFYNGYDPMFTWWMGMPYKQLDTALQEYAAVLRDKVAASAPEGPAAPASVPPVTPSAPPKYASVPDLQEILGLVQDEMRDVVARFNSGRPGGGGRGRGGQGGGGGQAGGGGAEAAPAVSPNVYYSAWLESLKSLDFDKLSRNAQVDYLYIRWTSETEIARAGEVIPPGPPRKPDTSDIKGQPRGRAGLIRDLNDNMIPYTPEQLKALATKEFAWCVEEMKKASRALGFGDDWKKALEHTKQTAVP